VLSLSIGQRWLLLSTASGKSDQRYLNVTMRLVRSRHHLWHNDEREQAKKMQQTPSKLNSRSLRISMMNALSHG
jgi:hypothetical protein